MWKKEEAQPQDICDYHRSMFIADSKLGSMLHSPQRLIQYIFRTFNVLYTPAVSFSCCSFVKKGISGVLCSNDEDDERIYTYFLNNKN